MTEKFVECKECGAKEKTQLAVGWIDFESQVYCSQDCLIAATEITEDYLDYLDRVSFNLDLKIIGHPEFKDQKVLSFSAFQEALRRWDEEYDQAWEESPPNWAKIRELENLLGV